MKKLQTTTILLLIIVFVCGCSSRHNNKNYKSYIKDMTTTRETTTEEETTVFSESDALKEKTYYIDKNNKLVLRLAENEDSNVAFGFSLTTDSVSDATHIFYYFVTSGVLEECMVNEYDYSFVIFANEKTYMFDSSFGVLAGDKNGSYDDPDKFFDYTTSQKRAKILDAELEKAYNDFFEKN